MKKSRETLVTAFAMFSLFFGAGNLILPPYLGRISGDQWWLVALGFALSAVLIPVLGILAHARLQGTMFDFASKVSPGFSLVYCGLVYAISVSLPSPRTASVTHEMAIAPLWDSPPLLTSTIYFMLVLLFVLNRNRILDLIGKYLSPALLLILLLIVGLCCLRYPLSAETTALARPFSHGILEGYQTFDAIGAVVVGGVILVSLRLQQNPLSYDATQSLVRRAGWLAGTGLFLVYAGLICAGAITSGFFDPDIQRTALLAGISTLTLGSANGFLSLLVSLACFTTAVGIVTGTADFVASRFPQRLRAYRLSALAACLLGVLVGQFHVGYIIAIAIPALMFIYPLTIVLILLNVLPERYTPPTVFRAVVATTLLFSVPDFLGSIGFSGLLASINTYLPLGSHNLGWLLPAGLVFALMSLYRMLFRA